MDIQNESNCKAKKILSLQILGEKFAWVADSLNECKEWHSVLNIKQFKSISAQKNIQKGNITSSIAMNEL